MINLSGHGKPEATLAANICFHIDTQKFAAFTWVNSNWGIDGSFCRTESFVCYLTICLGPIDAGEFALRTFPFNVRSE